MKEKRIRILLTKSQLDSHDRGVLTVGKALMNAGMEVIYTQFRLPIEIIDSAIQEDVDIIGISYASGGQMRVTSEVMRLLKEKELTNVEVVVGGYIRPEELPELSAMGVKGIFRGGDSLENVVNTIKNLITTSS